MHKWKSSKKKRPRCYQSLAALFFVATLFARFPYLPQVKACTFRNDLQLQKQYNTKAPKIRGFCGVIER